MDLTQLEMFNAVAEAGSITQAAAKVHRVPSNLTTRLRQLETELGVDLFIRENQRLRLSPAGHNFLRYSQQILALVDEARSVVAGDEPQFERQQWLLDEQLKLAKRYDLPVILHSRRTHDKLAMHLKRHDLPRTGVVHGFSGSLQQAERFVQLGYKIGVGGTITYPRASKTRDVIAKLPLASLLLETDAPDMPLNGFQGQPNRPEQAARVFAVLCELRREPADEIAQALLNNTYTLFNVP